MDSLSFSETRANLKAVIDRVVDDHAPVVVRRQRGGNVVLVSEEDWSGMEETLYLLRSPRNAERLLEAIEGLERGEGVERELIQL